MLHVTDLRGHTPSTSELRRVLPRGGTDVNAVLPTVTPIVEAVREGGAATALDYGEQFDHVRPTAVRVPAEVIQQAVDTLDDAVRQARGAKAPKPHHELGRERAGD